MTAPMTSTRPTTRLFGVHCDLYRAAPTRIDRWQRATESRDFYAVCIAKDATEGRQLSTEDAYCFRLFDRLRVLNHLAYLRAEHHAESVNA